MHSKSVRQIVTALILTALLLTPALPAWADGSHPAGLLGWLDGWLTTFTSWFSGAEAQTVNSVEAAEGEILETPQSLGDPPLAIEPLDSTDSNEEGPSLDPAG